jgi:hypothetical protein
VDQRPAALRQGVSMRRNEQDRGPPDVTGGGAQAWKARWIHCGTPAASHSERTFGPPFGSTAFPHLGSSTGNRSALSTPPPAE